MPAVGGASWRLSVSVTAYGYATDVRPLKRAEPEALGDRVEYLRDLVTEWYVNRPDGLEQGFILQQPDHPRGDPLVVALTVGGDLAVSASADGASFADGSGRPVVRYAGLKAWDAAGRSLPSRLEVQGQEVRLVVESSGARFPVTVDPTFGHEAQVFGTSEPFGQANSEFGSTVSIDGDTVLVGAPAHSGAAGIGAGAAYVFVRSGTIWNLQQELVASDGAMADRFGASVSITGDTAIVGASFDDMPGVNTGSAYVFVRSGTTWTEQQKLTASDGAPGDLFGGSVSISGDTAVVGANLHQTPGGVFAGSAYVFVRSGATWMEQQELMASDGAAFDHFGVSVSVAGDTVVVGAYGDDTAGGADAGSAYVFTRAGTSWSEQQKLLASDGAASDSFGISVSLAGDTAVIGAYWDDTPAGFDAGSAYVFVRSGIVWTEQQKLLASDGSPTDDFGVAVSVSGDTVVVGAFQDDPPGFNAGSAYVFVRSGSLWTEQQKLIAPDGAEDDEFGIAVAVSGDSAVVGSPGNDIPGGPDGGSVYVLARVGTVWTVQQQLLGVDGGVGDQFGFSVAVDGDILVVGAPGDSTQAGPGAGSAYAFVRSATLWTMQQKLVASDGAPDDGFGVSVSISGDTVLVGASLDDEPTNSGSAYVFVRSGSTWNEQQKLRASDGTADDFFGGAVAVSEETAIVGAWGADLPGAAAAGSAYVFLRAGTAWSEQQKLVASDAASADSYGFSVSIAGDTAAVGAANDDTSGGTDAGSAYVSVRSGGTWSEQQKLAAPDGAAIDRFGSAVSLTDDTAIIGAPMDDTSAGANAGSAYVFVRSGVTWSMEQQILASDGASDDAFGVAVSIDGDIAVVGADADDTPGGVGAGSAYVNVRSGSTWNEQQKLLAPDGEPLDSFGHAVSLSGATLAVGAFGDGPQGLDIGTTHVFRQLADLGVTKTDGQATAIPGQMITYAIIVSNAGPRAVVGATVTDMPPAALLGVKWTCVPSPGSTCTANGAGGIDDTVDLLVGGTASYTLTGTVDPAAVGTIANTATVAPPPGLPDPDPANNSATDIDLLTPQADLVLSKTESADPVSPGDPLAYFLAISNAGPSNATVVTVVDTLPTGVTFVSSVPGPPTCTIAGPTFTCDLGPLAAGAGVTVTINTSVDGSAGVLLNVATVSGAEPDPDPTNNSDSTSTTVGPGHGELAHGSDGVHDLAPLAGPTPDLDVFRISQKPYSSYEVVVDGTSGDIGVGAGPLLQRVAPDGVTLLQESVPIGTGSSRSLRWRNSTGLEIDNETIRVRSASCGTDCGPDDQYRIRAYETTYAVPRFNNSGTQVTVLVLNNPTSYVVTGEVYFLLPTGVTVGIHPFQLGAKETMVLNTAMVPGADGISGSASVAHDGRYGDLAGKTVALEPATGFSFDSALEPRVK